MARETIIGYELHRDLEDLVSIGRNTCKACGIKNPAKCPYYTELHKRIVVTSAGGNKTGISKEYLVITQGLGSICLECSEISWPLNLAIEEYVRLSRSALENAEEECEELNRRELLKTKTVSYDPAKDKPPPGGIIK